MVRRYFGKLIYELLLHQDEDFPSNADFYKEALEGATLVEYSRDDYLNDVDTFFYTAGYLRAWIVEAQLRWYLREKFDEEWWRVSEAGDFLKEMWKEGGRLSSDGVSKRCGFDPLNVSVLLSFFWELFD